MNIQDLIDHMKLHINNLKSDEEFLIKDLFFGYEWNRLNKNIRIQTGQIFLNQVNANLHPQVKAIIPKNKNNQQVYKKI